MIIQSMDKFFSYCGDLMLVTLREEGNSPQRKFTSVFYYQFGRAEYNGSTWLFDLCPCEGV